MLTLVVVVVVGQSSYSYTLKDVTLSSEQVSRECNIFQSKRLTFSVHFFQSVSGKYEAPEARGERDRRQVTSS